MSEQTGSSPPQTSSSGRGRRRFFTGLLAGVLTGGVLATGLTAFALGGPPWGPGSWHGMHGGDPAARQERLEFATDWILNRVGASDPQREQVKSIVTQAHADVASLRDQHLQNRRAFLDRLAQPSVDRAGLEQLRQAELALAEKASARIVSQSWPPFSLRCPTGMMAIRVSCPGGAMHGSSRAGAWI